MISDKVIPHNNGGTPDYWVADIRQATDYSPFGVELKNRDISLTSGFGGITPYRYSFQGQEHDDEIKGPGNSLNFEYRMHDPRLGRFFAIDPLVKDYPELTTYQFSSNRPIDYREIEGMEGTPATDAAFQVGLTNALASDLIFGIGREDAADIYPKSYSNQAAYLRGQIAGDIVAIFMSGIEIDAGYGQLITAGLLAVNIEGAPVTEPAALATTLGATITIVHGSLVAGAASKGLIDSKNQLNEIEGSSSSGNASSSNGGKKATNTDGQGSFGAGKDTKSKTSNEAFRKAKDQNGIPRSQQPTKQYKTIDKNTGKELRTYDFKNAKGEKITISKDNPIKYKDGGGQGPHYNAGQSGGKLKQHHDHD